MGHLSHGLDHTVTITSSLITRRRGQHYGPYSCIEEHRVIRPQMDDAQQPLVVTCTAA
jgi:hypothetical protein